MTISPEPNALSIVEVSEAVLPKRSTATKCEVPLSAGSVTRGQTVTVAPGGMPAVTVASVRSGAISAERAAR